jgi:hypothetical protein
MTPARRILSVLTTLRNTEARLEAWDKAHLEVTEQIYQIEADLENGVIEMDRKDSPLVAHVKALETLAHAVQYLGQQTYASEGMGSISWSHWFDDVSSAMEVLSASTQALRAEVAKRIGAVVV